jgi:hypothetical protein
MNLVSILDLSSGMTPALHLVLASNRVLNDTLVSAQ